MPKSLLSPFSSVSSKSGSAKNPDQGDAQRISMIDLAGSEILVGSDLGRVVYCAVRDMSRSRVVELCFAGCRVVDATFLREAVLRLIKVESPGREVVVTGFRERDHLDNLRYICNNFETPVTVVTDGEFNCVGMSLSPPLQTAVDKVLREKSLTSVQLAAFQGCTVQCASTNLNNLMKKGYITRVCRPSPTGGSEFHYVPFGYLG
jgi:hypothetical protein